MKFTLVQNRTFL